MRRNVRSGLAPYFMSEKALTKAIWPEAIRGLTGMAGSGQSSMHLYAWKSLFTFFILLSFDVSSLYICCSLLLSFVFSLFAACSLLVFVLLSCCLFVVSSLIVVRSLFVGVVFGYKKIKLNVIHASLPAALSN